MNPLSCIFDAAACTYRESLQAFRPWITTYDGNNVISEANITFHFARAFCTELQPAHAFLEREFRSQAEAAPSLKLDAYLTSPEIAVLFEAKVLVDSPTVTSVLKDINRVSADAALQQLGLHTGRRPCHTHGIVVAECWKPKLCSWWSSGVEGALRGMSESSAKRAALIQDGWLFDSVSIGSFHHGSPSPAAGTECVWLYAISPAYAFPPVESATLK